MKTIVTIIGAVVLAGSVSAVVFADSPGAPAGTTAMMPEPHPVLKLDDMTWGPAPPGLPAGSEAFVMAGDPSKPGFVSIRAKLPPGYKVPPHFHPTDEHVTVLSGSLTLGSGDTMDAATAQSFGPGGYFIAGAQMHHFVMTETGAVIQVDLEGPFEITYINPADDPRKTSN